MTAAPRRWAKARTKKTTGSKRTLIGIKRVYDPPGPADGTRILVDRLWPRGLSKDDAALDQWLKDVAPSNELRRWYGHAPDRFAEFRRRYLAELKAAPEAFAALRDVAGSGTVTLLTATRELTLSHAEVLKQLLTE